MDIIDRIKELVPQSEEIKDGIESIKAANDDFIGEDIIEEILNLGDISLSTKQLRDLEKTIEKSLISAATEKPLKSGQKEHDFCDEINDITMTVEEVINDLVREKLEEQVKKLQDLSEKIANLQKQIDDLEIPDNALNFTDIAYDLEMEKLGVSRAYNVSQLEMNELFADGRYIKIVDNPKPKNKCKKST